MEQNLLAISFDTIDNEMRQTVNARELHEFLKVGKFFANWIKDRIRQYDFHEGQDFIRLPISASDHKIDYHISISMAKELAMVERNEKEKEARRYFIECERRLKESNAVFMSKDDHRRIMERQDTLEEKWILIMEHMNEMLGQIKNIQRGFAQSLDDMGQRMKEMKAQQTLGMIGHENERSATEEYVQQMCEDMDSDYQAIRNFVRTFCVIEPGGMTPFILLYKIYRGWCSKQFMLAMTRNMFYHELEQVLDGITTIVKKNSKYHLDGIRLRQDMLDGYSYGDIKK